MSGKSVPFNLEGLGDEWRVGRSDADAGYATFLAPIEQSPNDHRQYRLITLRNGLTAMLISDPKTDKAAASLSVQIGHLSDPDDLPGLAHFCEHMLFLGTEKFPDEAEYKQYLSRNSGSSNAFTSMEETNYYFDVAPAALAGALARHSQFFTSPLFSPSCTERELNAVDSEFRRNLQLDVRRLFQLGKATSDPSHAYRKFGTGSKESLGTKDVRDRLLRWYAEHYSANLMNLVVISNQSLDELVDVVTREYSAIPNSNRPRPEFPSSPISTEQAATEVTYRTIKDAPQLRLEFPVPDLKSKWQTKPGDYISHFIGHEGEGSILAELKDRGWATSLSSGCSSGAAGFDFLRININLTAIGLKNYGAVISIVYEYLAILRSTPPLQWSWEETAQLGRIAWRFKEQGQPQSTARNLASQLAVSSYPPSKTLIGPWFADKWRPDEIKALLEQLQPKYGRVFVGSKEPIEGREFWQSQEKWYGTEYDILPLDVASLVKPVDPPAKLALPAANIFIPTKLDLLTEQPTQDPSKRPHLVHKTPTSRLFFKQDDTWCIPRASVYFLFKTPEADKSPRQAILTQLFSTLVQESLAKYSYDAALAGLSFAIGSDSVGFTLMISGYTEKLPVLLEVILNRMLDFQEVDDKLFELVHDRLTRAYRNVKMNNPSSTADSYLREITRQTWWSYDARLEALEGLSIEDVKEHRSLLLQQLEVDALVHGNFARSDAVDILKLAETKLSIDRSHLAENDYHRSLILPNGSNLVYRPQVPSEENVNSAASVYYQVGRTTDHRLMAKLSLFSQIAKVPVFSTLRTQEQLGYIVHSSIWSLNALSGFRVIVQSERTAEYLEERIEALWASFGKTLADLDEADFAKEQESLASKLEEKPKSLGGESSRYWDEIESGEFDFGQRTREARLIRETTKSDLIAFFETFIKPASTARAKLSILMRSQRFQPAILDKLRASVVFVNPDLEQPVLELVQSKPTVSKIEAFLTAHSLEDDKIDAALEQLRQSVQLADGVRELQEEEIAHFKSSLEKAPAPKPVADYTEDLMRPAHL
ncbi:uncharacterized protein JCM15063_001550 [Sporobolomyces koalae]|uniref:uncharacterized protein n=1 Tax=Sporobolomyces koalae TaxID=500713 RepID=UPI00317A5947